MSPRHESLPPPAAASSPITGRASSVISAAHLRLAGFAVCVFLATQLFQALCFYFWLPEVQSAAADYAARLTALDRARALGVLGGILAIAVAYVIVALDRFPRAPVASALGLIFTLFFVLLELAHRGVDFALVSREWAAAYAAATADGERQLLLERHALWSSITGAVYLPLMLSGLLAWTSFAVATAGGAGRWAFLAPLAFGANALRTLGRLAAGYSGLPGLGFLDSLHVYVALVFLIQGAFAAWLFWRARREAAVSGP